MNTDASRVAGQPSSARFEVVDEQRSKVLGSLDFATVSALLEAGSESIKRHREATVDLSGVTHSDSSGLALLIEWMSVARQAGVTLHYVNMPSQVLQLARLSEVEELLGA